MIVLRKLFAHKAARPSGQTTSKEPSKIYLIICLKGFSNIVFFIVIYKEMGVLVTHMWQLLCKFTNEI